MGQVLARGITLARDAGRESMLVSVLRALGAISERSSSNASDIISSRCTVPAFQLLGSRFARVRQVRKCTRQDWTSIQWSIHLLTFDDSGENRPGLDSGSR